MGLIRQPADLGQSAEIGRPGETELQQKGWRRLSGRVSREVIVLRTMLLLTGLAVAYIPVHAEPSWAFPVTDAGLFGVFGATLVPWEWAGGLAGLTAMAAIIESASSKLSVVALAAEGMLLLTLLLLVDAPARLPGPELRRWLRLLAPAALAGVAAAGVMLAALAAAPGASPWVALAGLAAAVAAYLLVLPLRPGRP